MPLVDVGDIALLKLEPHQGRFLLQLAAGYVPILIYNNAALVGTMLLWALFTIVIKLLQEIVFPKLASVALSRRRGGAASPRQARDDASTSWLLGPWRVGKQPDWLTHHEVLVEDDSGSVGEDGRWVRAAAPPRIWPHGVCAVGGHLLSWDGKWALAAGMNLRRTPWVLDFLFGHGRTHALREEVKLTFTIRDPNGCGDGIAVGFCDKRTGWRCGYVPSHGCVVQSHSSLGVAADPLRADDAPARERSSRMSAALSAGLTHPLGEWRSGGWHPLSGSFPLNLDSVKKEVLTVSIKVTFGRDGDARRRGWLRVALGDGDGDSEHLCRQWQVNEHSFGEIPAGEDQALSTQLDQGGREEVVRAAARKGGRPPAPASAPPARPLTGDLAPWVRFPCFGNSDARVRVVLNDLTQYRCEKAEDNELWSKFIEGLLHPEDLSFGDLKSVAHGRIFRKMSLRVSLRAAVQNVAQGLLHSKVFRAVAGVAFALSLCGLGYRYHGELRHCASAMAALVDGLFWPPSEGGDDAPAVAEAAEAAAEATPAAGGRSGRAWLRGFGFA